MNFPEVPAVAGIDFRFFRGETDIAAMLAVHAACRDHDRIDTYSVCYRLPNLSPTEYALDVAKCFADGEMCTVLLAFVGGEVIAHARLEWWDSYDASRDITSRVYLSRAWIVPAWRKKGLGTALLTWLEARARQIDADRPYPGELATNASEGEADARCLLEKFGYRPFFLSPELAFDDLAALPNSVTPHGFTVRSLDPADYVAVARALIEANANAPGSDVEWTEEMLKARYAAEEAQWVAFAASCDHGLSRIALQGSEVAAFYLCRSLDLCGDIANVGVRPAFRSRGLSRCLMSHSLHAMRERGLTTARVFTGAGIDPEAPPEGPYAMYLKLGFHKIAHHYRYRKPMASQ